MSEVISRSYFDKFLFIYAKYFPINTYGKKLTIRTKNSNISHMDITGRWFKGL